MSFRDAQNLPLQSVSISDLEAKIHGKPVKIVSLSPDPRPHRLVLVLDNSGSMGSTGRFDRESPLWALELLLARHFYEVNHQRSKIALLFFREQVNDVIDFAKGNSAVGEKLQQVAEDHKYVKTHIKGRTALRDAIFQGVQLLDHPSSADAIYVLTDGGDNASRLGAAELTRHLAETSVRVFAVLLQQKPGHQGVPEELSGPDELSEIALKSGGEILSAAHPRGNRVALSADPDGKLRTDETLARLYQAILQDSLLEVELPFPIAKNERWDLKLSSDARRQWKNVQITYPDTLISCNAEVFGSGRN